jgi:transcriptional regulator with XRE-family HTH domain
MRKSTHTVEYRRLIEALRKLRIDAGLTQEDVRKRLRTYASFLSKIESGERRLDVVELATLCKLYGVTLDEFLRQVNLID